MAGYTLPGDGEPLQAADGARVALAKSSSGFSGRLTIDLYGTRQATFLTAPQLRELARECEALAAELERERPADTAAD